jgi:hypothetical protein
MNVLMQSREQIVTTMDWTGLYVIALVWLGVLALVELEMWYRRQQALRAAVFASLDSLADESPQPDFPGDTSADDIAEWLQRYALRCYTEKQMLPHVRAWLRLRTGDLRT